LTPRISQLNADECVATKRFGNIASLLACALAMALGVGGLFAASPADDARTPEDKMAYAWNEAIRGRNAEAIAAYEAVAANPAVGPELKLQALYRTFECYRTMRNVDKAVETAARMRTAAPGIPDVARNSYILAADVLWQFEKRQEAIAKLDEFAQAFANQRADCAFMHMRAAGWYMAIAKAKDAAQEAAKAIAEDPANDKQVAQALWWVQEGQWQANDLDKCALTLKQLMDPKYMSTRNRDEQRNTYYRYADCLVRLKRDAELQALYSDAAKMGDDQHFRQEMLMRSVGLLVEQKRLDEALAQCERIFVENPDCPDYWYQAQQTIVDILRRQNRLAEALQAQRIVFDVTGDAPGVAAHCNLIAEMLKELDKNVTRANAFIDFQMYGPAGKPGGAGVVANPLAAVGYPSYPAREQAFARARADGDDVAFARQRALMCMYTGHPDQAVKYYADAFRRSLPPNVKDIGNEMIALGVRGVHGHCCDLDRFYAFVRYGPAGPGGKPGTADGLKDPFAELGVAPRQPAPDGGIQALPAEQQKTLLELASNLEAMVRFEREDVSFRKEALWDLARVHVALCDWGARGQAEFFEGLMFGDGNSQVQMEACECAQAAARNGDLHLAGVCAFWRGIDEKVEAGTVKKLGPAQQARGQFEATLRFFEKPPHLKPKLQPLK
jgi:tetratricopeptide (TPR) repeat protein